MTTRRDRDGEPLPEHLLVRLADPPEHHCTKGWLGDDEQGRPTPCPRCRPWVAAERRLRAERTRRGRL